MATDEREPGPGELVVRLLTCVERATDRVERVLPSVDHHAPRRPATTPGAVRSDLVRFGPADLVEPFEAWQRLLWDFDTCVAELTGLHDGGAEPASDYQARLDAGIADARRCRRAVEEAAEHLRRRVAAEIDTALAHEAGTR